MFLRTVAELERRVSEEDDEYEILMAAGLLRKLLLDGSRLVDQVNRHRKIPIRMHIAMRGPKSPVGDPDPVLWALPSGLEPSTAGNEPGVQIAEVDLTRFLMRPVSVYAGTTATVHDLIDYYAHVAGAVHSGEPGSNIERALKELEKMTWTEGLPLSLEILRSIGAITVTAMEPLVTAIRSGTAPVQRP